MSSVLRVSAPGKLILLGEYAVLFGAPAVVTAVDRRARVTATPATAGAWQVSVPGLKERPVEFGVRPGGLVQWASSGDGIGLELVEKLFAGWRDAGGSAIEELSPMALELDTADFFDAAGGERRKLGLGSSAALTAALAAALAGASSGGGLPLLGPQWLQRVVSLHRAVQNGRGSGADVAASLHGGLLEYRIGDAQQGAAVRPLDLPAGLHRLAVWTGRPAVTGAFLERLEAQRESRRARVDGALAALGAASRAGAAALDAADVEVFLEAVDASWAGFEALGVAIDMPILSSEHRRIRELAERCGALYKPSGAGGGDFGVAFSDDAGRLAELSRRVVGAGFSIPDLGFDAEGLRGPGM